MSKNEPVSERVLPGCLLRLWAAQVEKVFLPGLIDSIQQSFKDLPPYHIASINP